MHKSVKLDTPVEFINITPLNPLISKCQIKVCYVDDKPNRNGSVITKETAKQMANSLPGCPIVGFYNEDKGDFEEHNRIIDISNGKFEIKDTTRPYGFVDLSAKVWFQKFLDDGMVEREYMMTEGWLWTGQYPECRRILTKGNNQSMELDPDTLNASWSKDGNGELQFFIINEAIISKLCTLGEENEPCFEGASISEPIIQFAFADGFKEQVFSMMNELKELLNKGGEKVFTRYDVEIGSTLWNALYDRAVEGSYTIESVCEDGEQKFAVLTADEKYYRLDFSILEDESIQFANEVVALEDYTPTEEPQFSAEAIAEYNQSKEQKIELCEKCGKPVSECECEEEPALCDKCGKPVSECECQVEEEEVEEEDKVDKYNLDEIQEYLELTEKYSNLENDYNAAQEKIADLEVNYNAAQEKITNLEKQLSELTAFKQKIDKAEKQKMIDSFCMLSNEDKKDVIDNIDTYSLDDIEAKLSIICVRNKVSFNLDNDNNNGSTTFNLNDGGADTTPAWIKRIQDVAKEF